HERINAGADADTACAWPSHRVLPATHGRTVWRRGRSARQQQTKVATQDTENLAAQQSKGHSVLCDTGQKAQAPYDVSHTAYHRQKGRSGQLLTGNKGQEHCQRARPRAQAGAAKDADRKTSKLWKWHL
ncbi:hypothetical protein GGI20_005104, partial [Coemansia sp. BCRC 34301]